ncbi:MAG TPA: RloB domain-containing protein [Rickettsiales bacterium]|nr:RloB domain-containing protein [Rickettsiales bacterium]
MPKSTSTKYILGKTIPCSGNIIIEIQKADGTDAKSILKQAKEETKKYNQIFIEFDYDGNKQNAIDKRKAYKEVMEQTLPVKIKTMHFYLCFETWLLLHFGKEGYSFQNSDDIIKEINERLKSFHKPIYKKGELKQETFDFLYEKINIAIQMVKNINKNNKKEGIGLLDFFDYINIIETDLKNKKIEETRQI